MQTDIPINAGVIEGFFGRPWSWSARVDIIEFLAGCGYRLLLAGSRGPAQLDLSLEAPFVERLFADRELLQTTGLTGFDSDTRQRLLDWYESQKSNPYADEIAAWLRGDYRFDPECLTG